MNSQERQLSPSNLAVFPIFFASFPLVHKTIKFIFKIALEKQRLNFSSFQIPPPSPSFYSYGFDFERMA